MIWAQLATRARSSMLRVRCWAVPLQATPRPSPNQASRAFEIARIAKMTADQQPTPTITPAVIANALRLIGLDFTDGEIELMVKGINTRRTQYEQLRAVPLENSVPPALTLTVAPFA